MSDRIDQLSPRERECLRLVSRGFSSKEIALELGISHYTVDDHLKSAIATLEVPSRFAAARLLADREAGAPSPQPLGNQAPALASAQHSYSPAIADEGGGPLSRFSLPIRNGRRNNELTPVQRLMWIVIGAVLILFGLSQLANVLHIVQSIARGRV